MTSGLYTCYIGIPSIPEKRLNADSPGELARGLARIAKDPGAHSPLLTHVLNSKTHSQLSVTLDAPSVSAEFKHLNHAEPSPGHKKILEDGHAALMATEDLVRRFTGRWRQTRWTQFKPGTRLSKRAARMYKHYLRLYAKDILVWCDAMEARDDAASEEITLIERSFADLGWDTLATLPYDSSDEHADITDMIEKIRSATCGEDIAKAIRWQMNVYDLNRQNRPMRKETP